MMQIGEGQAAWLGIAPPQDEQRARALGEIDRVARRLQDLPNKEARDKGISLLIDARGALDRGMGDLPETVCLVEQANQLAAPAAPAAPLLRVQVVVTPPSGEKHTLLMLLPDILGRTPESVLWQIQDTLNTLLARQYAP